MYKWPLIHFNGPLLKAKADRYRLFIGYLWLAPFHRRGSFICSIYLPPRLGIGSGRVESSRVERSQETLNQKRNEEDSVWGITVDLCGCERTYKVEQMSGEVFLSFYRNRISKWKYNKFKTRWNKITWISKRLAKPNRITDLIILRTAATSVVELGGEAVTNFQKKKKKGNRCFSISIRLLINPESMRVVNLADAINSPRPFERVSRRAGKQIIFFSLRENEKEREREGEFTCTRERETPVDPTTQHRRASNPHKRDRRREENPTVVINERVSPVRRTFLWS